MSGNTLYENGRGKVIRHGFTISVRWESYKTSDGVKRFRIFSSIKHHDTEKESSQEFVQTYSSKRAMLAALRKIGL